MKTDSFPVNPDKCKDESVLGEKQGFFSRIFGCYHFHLSKPVTIGNVTYQYCSKCGARRQYDMKNFKPFGTFYCPKIESTKYYL